MCAPTSVCDVPEFALPVKLDEVREEVLLYQLRMELGNSIDLSAPNDCEIGHADLLWEALCNVIPMLATAMTKMATGQNLL